MENSLNVIDIGCANSPQLKMVTETEGEYILWVRLLILQILKRRNLIHQR